MNTGHQQQALRSGEAVKVHLGDEIPKVGSGFRTVIIECMGRKWVRLIDPWTLTAVRVRRRVWEEVARPPSVPVRVQLDPSRVRELGELMVKSIAASEAYVREEDAGRVRTKAAGVQRRLDRALAALEGAPMVGEFEPDDEDREEDDDLAKEDEGKTLAELCQTQNDLAVEARALGIPAPMRFAFETEEEAAEELAKLRGAIAAKKDKLAEPKSPPPADDAQEATTATVTEEDHDVATQKKSKTKTKKPAAKKAVKSATPARAPRGNGKPAKAASAFKPVRAGTARAKILALMDGTLTAEQIGKKVSLDAKTVQLHAHTMHRDCGIGHEVKDGKLKALYPAGKSLKSAVKAKDE